MFRTDVFTIERLGGDTLTFQCRGQGFESQGNLVALLQ